MQFYFGFILATSANEDVVAGYTAHQRSQWEQKQSTQN